MQNGQVQSEQTEDTKLRNALRQRCLLRGFVYADGAVAAVECLVRDISEAGARLTFAAPPPMAKIVELSIPVKGQKLKGKIAWRNEYDIGLDFVGASATDSSVPDDVTLVDRLAKLEVEIEGLKKIIKRLTKNSGHTIEAA